MCDRIELRKMRAIQGFKTPTAWISAKQIDQPSITTTTQRTVMATCPVAIVPGILGGALPTAIGGSGGCLVFRRVTALTGAATTVLAARPRAFMRSASDLTTTHITKPLMKSEARNSVETTATATADLLTAERTATVTATVIAEMDKE